MKVRSWKTLLVTVIFGGGLLFWEIKQVQQGSASAVFFCGLLVWVIIRGLYASLTKEGYEEDQQRAAKSKRIYREKFGRLAPIMPYLHLCFLLLAWVLTMLFPVTDVLRVAIGGLLVAALIYVIWLSWWFRREMDKEEQE